MKIIKVYTETTTAEKLYSVMLTEDEVALFSKMEDEDYLDEQRDRKRSVKHAKAKGAFLGGTTGAILGGRIGSAVSKNALKGEIVAPVSRSTIALIYVTNAAAPAASTKLIPW